MTLEGKNYRITKQNILCHEMIGLGVSAKMKGGNLSGKVIGETKNTFSLELGNGREKTAPKKNAVFEFSLGDEKVSVDGKKIMHRPENRLKALWGNQ